MYKKTKETKRLLHAHGCRIDRQGGKHEYWYSPITGEKFPVPRGRISKKTYFKILKQAGIKP